MIETLDMKYQDWIKRERRLRIKILRDWPEARDEGIYRVCQDCGEICLCSEMKCPNCESGNIEKRELPKSRLMDGKLIRCKKRYVKMDFINE